jgi:HEPN domain-containing protein
MNTDSLDVLKWIRRAQVDFDMAFGETKKFRPSTDAVCYLCQQSVEKILKAYTIAQTGSRTASHALKNLLDECKQYSADFDNLVDNCSNLTPYMTIGRYPSNIEVTEYDMKQAIKDASQVLEFTKSKLKKLGYEYEPEQGV